MKNALSFVTALKKIVLTLLFLGAIILVGFLFTDSQEKALDQMSSETFPVGQVLPSLSLMDFPEESYALYLPENYERESEAPLLVFFDAAGRSLEIAERYGPQVARCGWILVVSNSYRGGVKDPYKIAKNLFEDLEKRFDVSRYYISGFSWGGWLAAGLAYMSAKKLEKAAAVDISGIIPIAPPCLGSPTIKASPLFRLVGSVPDLKNYFLVGREDSFYDEILYSHYHLFFGKDQQSYLVEYPGGHELPPDDLFFQAIEQMELDFKIRESSQKEELGQGFREAVQRELEKIEAEENPWDRYLRGQAFFLNLHLPSTSQAFRDLVYDPLFNHWKAQKTPELQQELVPYNLFKKALVIDFTDLNSIKKSRENWSLLKKKYPQSRLFSEGIRFETVYAKLEDLAKIWAEK